MSYTNTLVHKNRMRISPFFLCARRRHPVYFSRRFFKNLPRLLRVSAFCEKAAAGFNPAPRTALRAYAGTA